MPSQARGQLAPAPALGAGWRVRARQHAALRLPRFRFPSLTQWGRRFGFFSFLFFAPHLQCVVSRLQEEATLADFGRAPRGALRCRRGISCRSRPPLLPPLRCRWKSGPPGGRGDDARRFCTRRDGLLHAWPQLHVLRLDCSSCFSFALISRQRSSCGGVS